MKKVLAILLSVAMLACFATSALAADAPVFTVESIKAEAGSTVTVNVKLDAGKFDAANLFIKYDASKAKIVMNEDEEYITAETKSLSMQAGNVVTQGDDTMLKWGASTTKSVKNEVLFSFIVEVAEGLAEGDTIDFTFVNESVKFEGAVVEPTFNNGAITIGKDEPTPPSSSGIDNSSSSEEPVPPSSSTPSTTAPSTNNPKTGDAGVAVFAGIVAAAAAAAFVVGKKKA